MKKHLIALAALSTLASFQASAQEALKTDNSPSSTAYTQPSSTESVLYGRIQTAIEGVRVNHIAPTYAFGPTHVSSSRVNSDNSFIGFRVKERLDSNLSVFADIQIGVNADDGTMYGTNNNNLNRKQNDNLRRSIVGLQSSYGTFWAGKDETAYFSSGREFDPFYNTSSASTANILGRTPYSAYSLAPYTGFNSRFGNTVGFKSPTWYNTTLEGSYTVNERNDLGDSRVSSLALNYRDGRFLGTLAYERQNHTDVFNSTGKNRDSAVKAALGYQLNDNYKVSFVAERASNLVNTSFAQADYDRNAYSVGITKYVGPGEILASYTRAKGGSLQGTNVWGFPQTFSTPDMGASQLSLGYRYNLSRRTNVLASATLLNNKAGANYDLNFRPVGVSSGNDIRVYGLGLEHKF